MFTGCHPFKHDIFHLEKEKRLWVVKTATQREGTSAKNQADKSPWRCSSTCFYFSPVLCCHLVQTARPLLSPAFVLVALLLPFPSYSLFSTSQPKVMLRKDCHSSIPNLLWLIFLKVKTSSSGFWSPPGSAPGPLLPLQFLSSALLARSIPPTPAGLPSVLRPAGDAVSPVAALINQHKLHGLTQHMLIILHFQRSEL